MPVRPGWFGGAAALLVLCGCAPPTADTNGTCIAVRRDDSFRPSTEFFGISGLVAAPDGGVYVLDSRRDAIVALRPDGRMLWQAGRRGAGPAEFINATGLHGNGVDLALRDLGNHRLSLWATDGTHVRTISLSDFRLPGYPGWMAYLGSERVAVAIAPPPLESAASDQGILVVAHAGMRLDTLRSFTFPATTFVEIPGGRIPMFPPFAAFPSFALVGTGAVAAAAGETYHVDIFGFDGALRAQIRGPDGRPRVEAHHREDYLAARNYESLPPQLSFPTHLPAVNRIVGTPDGSLLVKTNWTDTSGVQWDRWTIDGSYEGSLVLPERVVTVVTIGDDLYAQSRDSLDDPRIERFTSGGSIACPGPVPVQF